MLNFLKRIFGRDSVDAIVGDSKRVTDRLHRHSDAKLAEAVKHDAEAQRLREASYGAERRKTEAIVEANRAHNVAKNIGDLLVAK